MKVLKKVAAPVAAATVKAAAPKAATGKVPATAKVVAAVKDTARKVVSLLYQKLTGTWLYAPCLRKEDMTGNPIVENPPAKGAAKSAVLVIGSRFGQCLSVGPVTPEGVAVLSQQMGVDTKKFAQAMVLKPEAAHDLARKKGSKCVIEHQGKNWTGHLVGNLAQMYVWFSDGRNFLSLDTKRISDGRNKDRLFKLVKQV